jgi:hypothetical protein
MDDHMVQSALAFVPKFGPCAKRLVGIMSLQNQPVRKVEARTTFSTHYRVFRAELQEPVTRVYTEYPCLDGRSGF